MEILYSCMIVVWVVGWIKQVAFIDALMNKNSVDYPCSKDLIVVILFFTWPYFYFYIKALYRL